VSGGIVYVGSGDSNVYALRASDGTRSWTYSVGNAVYSGIAVAGGAVYAGSYDNRVYALTAGA
jgi:outer membrane protein assembly factor BamB